MRDARFGHQLFSEGGHLSIAPRGLSLRKGGFAGLQFGFARFKRGDAIRIIRFVSRHCHSLLLLVFGKGGGWHGSGAGSVSFALHARGFIRHALHGLGRQQLLRCFHTFLGDHPIADATEQPANIGQQPGKAPTTHRAIGGEFKGNHIRIIRRKGHITQALHRWRGSAQEADMLQIVAAGLRIGWVLGRIEAGADFLEAARLHHLGKGRFHLMRFRDQVAAFGTQGAHPAIGRCIGLGVAHHKRRFTKGRIIGSGGRGQINLTEFNRTTLHGLVDACAENMELLHHRLTGGSAPVKLCGQASARPQSSRARGAHPGWPRLRANKSLKSGVRRLQKTVTPGCCALAALAPVARPHAVRHAPRIARRAWS